MDTSEMNPLQFVDRSLRASDNDDRGTTDIRKWGRRSFESRGALLAWL